MSERSEVAYVPFSEAQEYIHQVIAAEKLACQFNVSDDPFAPLPEDKFDIGNVSANNPVVKELRQLCRPCPVRLACLFVAFDTIGITGNTDMFWANHTPRELRRIRERAFAAVKREAGGELEEPYKPEVVRAVVSTAFRMMRELDSREPK